MSALLPCPFCGAGPTLEDHRTIWCVKCDCGATMLGERAPEPTRTMSDKYWKRFEQTAIDRWNRRPGSFGPFCISHDGYSGPTENCPACQRQASQPDEP